MKGLIIRKILIKTKQTHKQTNKQINKQTNNRKKTPSSFCLSLLESPSLSCRAHAEGCLSLVCPRPLLYWTDGPFYKRQLIDELTKQQKHLYPSQNDPDQKESEVVLTLAKTIRGRFDPGQNDPGQNDPRF